MKAKENNMDLDEIKKIIEKEGGKIIVVEQGKPILVITSFEDYAKTKPEPEKKTEKPVPPESNEEELKIEDLPF